MLYLYERGEEADCLIAQWWAVMKRDGDLERLFANQTPISRLYELSRKPSELLIGVDEGGIWFGCWLEPFFDGASFSAWCRKDRRGTKAELRVFLEAANLGFGAYPLLIGITKQPQLLKLHTRLGYRLRGQIPALWGGEEAFILVWDRLDFLKDKEGGRWARLMGWLPQKEA